MTGPGTNSYLVGEETVALIDPGPAIDSHIEAILKTVGDKLRWVCVTHTHGDHSPAAQPIAAATGAELIGNTIENDGYQDTSFISQRTMQHDGQLQCEEYRLRALLTPGHVSNHICYLVEQERLLFTGDHIMGGSTVVIIPPAGDMQHYLASLEMLLGHDLAALAPGHGAVIAQAHDEIRGIIAHRLKRERKVVEVLGAQGPCRIGVLLPVVYDDVDPVLHPMAEKSLLAHLLKLSADGRAARREEDWLLL
jgi:glyoxylase-like metal-dependent hydrolase (beta-lactamase superfamily II)